MKRRIPVELLVFAAGLALFAVGAYLVYPPAALIVPGVILMAISIFGDKK